MAKWCPITGEKVLYLECLECDDKICKNPKQEKQTDESKEPVSYTHLMTPVLQKKQSI